MSKAVKKLTGRDKAALSAIKRCGFLSLDLNGKPALEVDFEVTAYRMNRLVALGYLQPNSDALLADSPPQTFALTEKAADVA